MFWGVFDPVSRILRYVNAGHAAPMLVRGANNQIERLKDGGPVLGMLPKACYTAGTVTIGPADRLVLYSDGIDEATNRNQEEFGEHRIKQALTGQATGSPSELCDVIMKRIQIFANGERPKTIARCWL